MTFIAYHVRIDVANFHTTHFQWRWCALGNVRAACTRPYHNAYLIVRAWVQLRFTGSKNAFASKTTKPNGTFACRSGARRIVGAIQNLTRKRLGAASATPSRRAQTGNCIVCRPVDTCAAIGAITWTSRIARRSEDDDAGTVGNIARLDIDFIAMVSCPSEIACASNFLRSLIIHACTVIVAC